MDDPLRKQEIAIGHHLEWLALALELPQPPRESIRKAALWAIDTTLRQTPEEISQHDTIYSHVGGALALWRRTRPADFWKAREKSHANGPF